MLAPGLSRVNCRMRALPVAGVRVQTSAGRISYRPCSCRLRLQADWATQLRVIRSVPAVACCLTHQGVVNCNRPVQQAVWLHRRGNHCQCKRNRMTPCCQLSRWLCAANASFAARSSGVEVALATVLLGVVGVGGHISNQLEDFLLQVFGWLQLASHLDSGVTTFRNESAWQRSLPSPSRTHCDVRNPRVERQDESHPHIHFSHANGPSSCKCCSRQELRASGAVWVACGPSGGEHLPVVF